MGVAAVIVAALVVVPVGAAAQTQPPTVSVAPPPPPKAWIAVDASSGRVLAAENAREPLRVASAIKILTALAAVTHLPPDTPIPVSARAEAMPARKLNMKAGQVWDLEDTLHSLLLSSANDAALALAERVAGSAESFADTLDHLAAELGMEDSPLLLDPSGLDDEFSIKGGNLISARDLAIATRAFLAHERLAPIAATPVYSFTGGDGILHRLGNHNQLLKTYPGAVGVKTGYTRRAGHCLVAAATRDGRTVIAVVIDAVDAYGNARALLDRGFASGAGGAAGGDTLPRIARLAVAGAGSASAAVDGAAALASTGRTADRSATEASSTAIAAARSAAEASDPWWQVPVTAAGGLAALVGGLRMRVHVRRWRRRQRRLRRRHARIRPPVHRRPDPVLTTEYRPREESAYRFHHVVEGDTPR